MLPLVSAFARSTLLLLRHSIQAPLQPPTSSSTMFSLSSSFAPPSVAGSQNSLPTSTAYCRYRQSKMMQRRSFSPRSHRSTAYIIHNSIPNERNRADSKNQGNQTPAGHHAKDGGASHPKEVSSSTKEYV